MANLNFRIHLSLDVAAWEAARLWEEWLSAPETIAEGVDSEQHSQQPGQ